MEPYTVLMVEDNAMIRTIYRETLGVEGYRLLEAASLGEGRALLETESPDLIMMDVDLPDGSGLDLCRALCGGRPSTIPILIVSTLVSKHDINAGYEAGCDDYLVKPFLNKELLGRVKALLLRRDRKEQYGPDG